MKLGNTIPPWRLPRFWRDTLTYAPLTEFRGTPFALYCLSELTDNVASILTADMNRLRAHHVELAVFLSHHGVTTQCDARFLSSLPFMYFTDPLQRVRRTLKLSATLSPTRCEALLFDEACRLVFRLIDDLNSEGRTRIQEVAQHLFPRATPRRNAFASDTDSWPSSVESPRTADQLARVPNAVIES